MITRRAAAAIIRKAYEEGRLTRQIPQGKRIVVGMPSTTPLTTTGDNGLGAYICIADDDTEYRCAIGQLLPRDLCIQMETGQGGTYMMAGALIANGKLEIPPHQGVWFVTIQKAHDRADWDRFETLLSQAEND